MTVIPSYHTASFYHNGNIPSVTVNGKVWRNVQFDGTETRGSIFGLEEGTAYTLTYNGGSVSFTTLTVPERPLRTLPSNGIITESGLYENGEISGRDYGLRIQASGVTVRGFSIHDVTRSGILIENGVSDIVIEDCDIYNFGPSAFQSGSDAGIASDGSAVSRVLIQNNLIHDPNGGATSWLDGHPGGTIGIQMQNPGGRIVIRYNEIYSTYPHYFRDGMRGGVNFSNEGFPGPDSDIYGNKVSQVWDDAIEVEGGGKNVRVWENYITKTFTFVACAPVAIGPLYVVRNVFDESQQYDQPDSDTYRRGPAIKAGEGNGIGRGRAFFLHNVTLQRPPEPGKSVSLGARGGIYGNGGVVYNHVSRGNIWQAETTSRNVFTRASDGSNSYDFDVLAGRLGDVPAGSEANGEIRNTYLPITIDFDGHRGTFTPETTREVEDVGFGTTPGVTGEMVFGVRAEVVVPPICTIQARSRKSRVRIDWTSENAETVLLNGEPVEPSGFRMFPLGFATYTISAANSGGASSASVTVRGRMEE